ncbi:hypothetical protein V9T40_007747 [Parthenolecanium corni]|uniref:Uncharacterized protein n=1 Tax=Parthenolecanium corni TaxID=536013 RepID=A0AAN9THM9_9HEMI
MTRKTPPSYSDGVYMMVGDDRPSPRTLSTRFMKGQDGLSSVKNRTALLAFFGQVVSSEIVMGSEKGCPIEVHDIKIEKCDPMYDSECKGGKSIPFHRAGYDIRTGQSPNNPRQQINRVTSWIDGSFIYSTSEAWVNTMRSFVNGTLKTDKTGKLPIKNTMRVPLFNNPVPHVLRTLSPERLFLLGDPRSNQNPALLAFSILWYRWHNIVAAAVQQEHTDWPDEEVFQRTRRIVVATLQNIIAYEYVPAFLGQNLTEYRGYNVDVHPGISHVFQTAAFRFGHTLIPPGIYRRDGRCNFKKSSPLRLCSHWWDSSVIKILQTIYLDTLCAGGGWQRGVRGI